MTTQQNAELNNLFLEANSAWDKGNLKEAFRLFHAGAKLGDAGAQHNLAFFLETGKGTRTNKKTAQYWYRRAFRRGSRISAANLAVMYREIGDISKSIAWFKRAAALGDADSNLEIAKLLIKRGSSRQIQEARILLKKVRRARKEDVTKAAQMEASELLARL